MSFNDGGRALLALQVLMGGLVLGCATSPRWYEENPRLEVRVWGGFAESAPPAAQAQRVEVLVDGSSAMRNPMPAGPSRAQVARTAATRFVFDLPASATVRLSATGIGGDCAPPHPLGRSAPGEDRLALAASLAALEPGGNGGVAHGLLDLADSLRVELEPTRVVAFSDLSDSCGVDLCTATAALESVGASLDLVVIGDAVIPECVAATRRSEGTGDLPATIGERAIPIRVFADGSAALEGQVGGAPIETPADPVTVVVGLDPPLTIGPMRLPPDSTTRLEILEFPHTTPRVREWRWESRLVTAEGGTP